MNEANHVPPERTTPEQRQREIAQIVARVLARARMGGKSPVATPATESEVSLGFSGNQRVNTNPS